MKHWGRLIMNCLVIINIVILVLFLKSPKKEFVVHFLDVGQGDAIVVQTPDLKYVLIDGGPDDLALKELQDVLPFWHKRIDVMILTHPDTDHVGGLPDILEFYDVGEVIFNDIEHETKVYKRFKRLVEDEKALVHYVNDLKNFQVGCCVYFDTLWPVTGLKGEDFVEEPNEYSTAFIVHYEDFSMYTGGDLGFVNEEKSVRKGGYDIDLLKVDHHGSTTSTSAKFLEVVKPEVAVIPVGEGNRYGHPKPEIIANLEQIGVKIFRTDQQGRVEIVYKDNGYEINTQK